MPKTKVSGTVEGSLLRQVERMARGASRSEVVESALASRLRNRRRERLEEEIVLVVTAASLLVAAACVSTKKPGPGDCPPPRQSNEICPQVVVWAKNPQTGACCQYGTPCNAPEGWKTYNSEAECRAGSSS